jgi:hypothetical protein
MPATVASSTSGSPQAEHDPDGAAGELRISAARPARVNDQPAVSLDTQSLWAPDRRRIHIGYAQSTEAASAAGLRAE